MEFTDYEKARFSVEGGSCSPSDNPKTDPELKGVQCIGCSAYGTTCAGFTDPKKDNTGDDA